MLREVYENVDLGLAIEEAVWGQNLQKQGASVKREKEKGRKRGREREEEKKWESEEGVREKEDERAREKGGREKEHAEDMFQATVSSTLELSSCLSQYIILN